MNMDCNLVESKPFWTHLEEVKLEEGRTLRKGVIMQARGKFAHAGKITDNDRMYRVRLMKREIKRLTRDDGELKQKAMIGEADHPHPTAGGPSISRSALIQTGLGMNDLGEVQGEIDVVDTAAGKDLAALIRAGAQVGFSSRARGTTSRKKMTSEDPDYALNQEHDGQEFEDVNEDFHLVAFDAVIGPAVSDAHVGDFHEQKTEEVVEMKLEDILKDKDLLKQVLESDPAKKMVEDAVKASRGELEKQWAEEIKPLVKEHMNSEEFFNAHFEVADEGADDGDVDEQAVKCADCDAAVPKSAKFCPACGTKVAAKPAKEQTQDEKDKVIEDLKKRLDKIEGSTKEKDEKIDGLEKREEDRQVEVAVESIVVDTLKGEVAVVVENVRGDIDELTERGEVLTEKTVKEYVEARVKRYKVLVEASGGSLLAGKGKAKGVEPDDIDEKKVEEKKKEEVQGALDGVD